MTNTNAFLPYATATGANVESPANWASDTVRQLGLVTGIVSSQKLNQALRQASVPSAMIAQFIADYGTSSVNDDGNLSLLETQFVGALNQVISSAVGSLIPAAPSISSLWHQGSATAGTSSAFTTTLSPTVSTSATGFFFYCPITTTNTLTSGYTTIDFGDGPKPIVLNTSGTDAPAGSMPGGAGFIAKFYYDGTYARLTNPYSSASAADTSYWHIGTPAGGTANTLTTTLTPIPPAVVAGLCIRLPVVITNTGSATLTINTAGGSVTLPIVGNKTDTALSGGEMPGGINYEADLVVDSSGNLRLFNSAAGTTRYKCTFYSTSATITPSAGFTTARATLTAPGGGGGGCAAGQNAGAGGGAGETSIKTFSSWATAGTLYYVQGAAGAGGVAVAGSNGGNSSFGPMSADGGQGSTYVSYESAGGLGGTGGSGGDIQIAGGGGDCSYVSSNSAGGSGGASFWGGGGAGANNPSANGGLNGYPGQAPGSGGSGADGPNAMNGGNGAPGLLMIEEYA